MDPKTITEKIALGIDSSNSTGTVGIFPTMLQHPMEIVILWPFNSSETVSYYDMYHRPAEESKLKADKRERSRRPSYCKLWSID